MRFVLLVFLLIYMPALAELPDREDGAKRILLLGKTGAGKSTLIQMFHEHARGHTYFSEREFLVAGVGDPTADQTQSQTKQFTPYRIKLEGNKPIDLVDSPGIFDTSGQSMSDFERELTHYLDHHQVHGIAIVTSSEVRDTTDVQEVRSLVQKLFGPNISDNMFLFSTHSYLPQTKAAHDLYSDLVPKAQHYFFFESSCLSRGDGGIDQPIHLTSSNCWQLHANEWQKFQQLTENLAPISSLGFQERLEAIATIRKRVDMLVDDYRVCLTLINRIDRVIDQVNAATERHEFISNIKRDLDGYDSKVPVIKNCHGAICAYGKEKLKIVDVSHSDFFSGWTRPKCVACQQERPWKQFEGHGPHKHEVLTMEPVAKVQELFAKTQRQTEGALAKNKVTLQQLEQAYQNAAARFRHGRIAARDLDSDSRRFVSANEDGLLAQEFNRRLFAASSEERRHIERIQFLVNADEDQTFHLPGLSN